MAKVETKITYEDYQLIQDTDKRYEVIDGRLFMVPAPTPYHQRASRNLEYILHQFVTNNDLGEVFDAPCDVVLTDVDVVQPDIFFISKEREYIITEKNINGAPDLIIEVISPFTKDRDKIIKRKLYAQHNVKEYWIVDPDAKTVEVLTLGEEGFDSLGIYTEKESFESKLLTGLKIDLKEIF